MTLASKRRRKLKAAAEERQRIRRENIPSAAEFAASIRQHYPHLSDSADEIGGLYRDFMHKWLSGPALYDGR